VAVIQPLFTAFDHDAAVQQDAQARNYTILLDASVFYCFSTGVTQVIS
jgi:hypothetical protein